MRHSTFIGMVVVLLLATGAAVAQEAANQRPSALTASDLQQRAVDRLNALADQLDRETKQASSDFSNLSKGYPGGEYTVLVNKTLKDLKASNSPVTKGVLSTPDVQAYTKALEFDPEAAGRDPFLVRGQLFGTVSEIVGEYKADAAYIRALANSIKAAPADNAISLLNNSYMPPKVAALIDPPREDTTAFLLSESPSPTGLAFYATGSGRVVGRAKPTIDYPAVVQLMQDYGERVMTTSCTGTLIAPNVVLSAAHCFCEFDNTQRYLDSADQCRAAKFRRVDGSKVDALGTAYRRVYFQHAGQRRIAKIEIHDEFHFPHADLAIVVLEEPVIGIAPADIVSDQSIQTGETGVIVGFGRHSRLDSAGQPLAMRAEDNEAGLKFWAQTKIGTCKGDDTKKTLVCWTYDTNESSILPDQGNTCNGDSGGPLFATRATGFVLAGVTSGGKDRNCGPADYSFDVDVFGFRDWIVSKLAANAPAAAATQMEFDPLAPETNDYQSFVVWKNWSRFDFAKPAWDHEFDIPSGVKLLRFGVNSHVLTSSRPLHIQLWSPDGKLACDVKSDENVLMCPRLDDPPQGHWRFTIEGPAGLDFQAVATAFAKNAL